MTARFALVALLTSLPIPARACTFCDGSFRTMRTLRINYSESKIVAAGQMKNPRFDATTNKGTTDFYFGTVLKDDPVRAMLDRITVEHYLPIVGNTPPDFLVFFETVNGKLNPQRGVPLTPSLLDYLKAVATLDGADPVKTLGFYFRHLDSEDGVVAEDAFYEFARAADADILKAAKQFDPAKLRKLIADPKTNRSRLGVFAFVLGCAGGAADAAFLADLLKQSPQSENVASAFGGLLAGYILLAPRDGWALATVVVGDTKREYGNRFAVINAVRGLQGSRPEFKADMLKCYAAVLPHGDLADLCVEDLRRWGWWDLSADVFSQYPKPTHAAPIVRRAIVRYALSCPKPEAKTFLDAARTADPKLVKSVEEMMSLYDSVPTPKQKP